MSEGEETPISQDPDPLAEPPSARRLSPPPAENACCARCGSADVSALPYFSAGSGTGRRPLADDVYCRRCGNIAPPDYV